MANMGLLLIISGPSGVGKGSICEALLAKDETTIYSTSVTTRPPRKDETEGINYYFISEEEFFKKRDNGEFLEWAKVFGNYYATPQAEIERLLYSGKNVVLEIDTQGAMQVKSACPKGIYIFILPPSYDELKKRIISRGSETKEALDRRLACAYIEMGLADKYDYQLVNIDIENTANQLLAIINKEKQAKQLDQKKEEPFVK